MHKLILFIVAFLISTVSFANTETLRFNQIDAIPNSHYDHLRVIDMRENKADIGFVRKRIFKSNRKLITDKPLDETLTDYFNSLISQPVEHNELVLVLYHFKVEFLKDGSEYSYIHFDGDFYRADGSNYVYLGNSNEFIDKYVLANRLLVVTQHIVRDIFINKVNILSNKTDSTKYSMQGIMDRRNNIKHSFPVYNVKQFKKGIYLTVDQFLDNTPLDTPFTVVYLSEDDKVHHFRYYYEQRDGSKGPRIGEEAYFAIYDGERWANSSGYFGVEMQHINDDFYTIQTLIAGNGNMMLGRKLGINEKKLKRHVARYPASYECRFDPYFKTFRRLTRMNQ